MSFKTKAAIPYTGFANPLISYVIRDDSRLVRSGPGLSIDVNLKGAHVHPIAYGPLGEILDVGTVTIVASDGTAHCERVKHVKAFQEAARAHAYVDPATWTTGLVTMPLLFSVPKLPDDLVAILKQHKQAGTPFITWNVKPGDILPDRAVIGEVNTLRISSHTLHAEQRRLSPLPILMPFAGRIHSLNPKPEEPGNAPLFQFQAITTPGDSGYVQREFQNGKTSEEHFAHLHYVFCKVTEGIYRHFTAGFAGEKGDPGTINNRANDFINKALNNMRSTCTDLNGNPAPVPSK
ncbi:MAG: hypothetical protein L6Q57_06730 [Alphaproteobacteria bacterium]|nr:hypothetical protein [Alphaproteobacteria bacterium]